MSGAVNNQYGIVERDITLKVARYLRDFLNQYDGVEVIMTHDGNLPSNYELEISERGMIARRNQADLLVSLHFNATETDSLNGAEVYVTANKLLPKYNQESTELGNKILNNLSKLGIANRGVKTRLCNDTGPKWEYSDGSKADYYGVIRYAMKGDGEDRGANLANGEGIPGILIEHCFIRGTDVKYINSDAALYQLALADGQAIVEHYGLTLKTERVQSISLDSSYIEMLTNESKKVNANIQPNTAKNKNIKWTSSNEKVATVSNDGTIKAMGEGRATITATTEDKGLQAKVEINVTQSILQIENGKEWNMIAGTTTKLLTEINPITYDRKNIEWSSSNEEVATVKDGIVTAKKEGEATITAKMKQYNIQDEIKIHIHGNNEKIEIDSYQEEQGIITKIAEKISQSEFKKHFKLPQGMTIQVEQETIGSGTKVQIVDNKGQVIQEYICLLYGDVNGDSKITAVDYTLIKNHIMEVKKVTSQIQNLGADVNQDNKITAVDYTLIKNHIMDVKKIEQK